MAGLYDRGPKKIFQITVYNQDSEKVLEQTLVASMVHVVHGMTAHELKKIATRVNGAVVNLPVDTNHVLKVLPIDASSLSPDQHELLEMIDAWDGLRSYEMSRRELENVVPLIQMGLVRKVKATGTQSSTPAVIHAITRSGELILRPRVSE